MTKITPTVKRYLNDPRLVKHSTDRNGQPIVIGDKVAIASVDSGYFIGMYEGTAVIGTAPTLKYHVNASPMLLTLVDRCGIPEARQALEYAQSYPVANGGDIFEELFAGHLAYLLNQKGS